MSNPPPVRPPITTHVLDTAKGQPAGHMTIKVFVYDSVRDDWSVISEGCVCGTTDTDALICVCMGGGGGGEKSNWAIALPAVTLVTCDVPSSRVTNEDGRCPSLLAGQKIASGCYKIKFDTKSYFDASGIKGFYPYVEVS